MTRLLGLDCYRQRVIEESEVEAVCLDSEGMAEKDIARNELMLQEIIEMMEKPLGRYIRYSKMPHHGQGERV